MKKKITIIFLIFFIIIPFTLQQFLTNITNSKNTKDKIQSSSSGKEVNIIELFFIIITIFVIITLVIFGVSKVILLCCKKSQAFQQLMGDLQKNENISNELLYQIKFTYGVKYIIMFLVNKIFTSTKYKIQNIKYFGNCTICVSDFNENEKIYITSCRHIFHRKCMINYLELIEKEIEKQNQHELNNSFKCPNCKQLLFLKKKIQNTKKSIKENNISDSDINSGSTNRLQNVNKRFQKTKHKNDHDFENNNFMINSNRNLENSSTKNLPLSRLPQKIVIKLNKNRNVNKQSIAVLRNNFVN